MFRKYQHIERLGTDEVEGILSITEPVYIFPKLDGTNGSVWIEDGVICCGSRNRQLTLDNDNQGFMAAMMEHEGIKKFMSMNKSCVLYGEWLVPHTLKTYQQDAWRKFYVFDVVIYDNESPEYIIYEHYQPMLEYCGVDYIPPLAIIEEPTEESVKYWLDKNYFLMNQDCIGEGVVLKTYGFKNRFGRTTWAKIVRNEFKAQNAKAVGAPRLKGAKMIEEELVIEYLTEAMIEKVYANIVNECNGWNSRFIPRLLSSCFHDLVTEEIWNIVKKHKCPKIDFKALKTFCDHRVKFVKKDLF
jgi:hypothetical protein